MSEHHAHAGQWEGFEQFHDISQPNHSQLPQIKRHKVNPKKEESSFQISPHKAVNRQRKALRKQSDIRIDITNHQPPQQEKIEKQSQTVVLLPEQKVTSKAETKRYERIPLIRFQEDCRYGGRIVYKSFIPRTSDKYLRVLKEVDWQLPKDKKRDIRNLHGIQFNSQFESGNLNLAIEVQMVSDLQYDLYMRVDTNTNGHRQWFYFSMKNEKKCKVRLHIYRFRKNYSLFQRGMKPYVKSRKSGNDWMPGGDQVIYHFQRQRNEYGVNKEVKSFVLTFTYTFEHENDEVFIAAGIPYSYTFLYKQLNNYKQMIEKKQNMCLQVSTLCKSMCGLDLPLVTVEHKMSKLLNEQQKKIIIINARTHSGQASSSWVMDGILMQLAQSNKVQQWLLTHNIVLKIVPMLNPDGVFIGNYRTGIIGDDFNRKFYTGRKQFHPEIYALKKLVNQSKKQGNVELFLDLHGHSILKNSFIYGPSQADISKHTLKSLHHHLEHSSKYFRLASCKFKTEKQSIETARVFFQIKEDILSFTCQNSLGLYYNQEKTFQMLSGDWQAFGQSIVNSMISSFTDNSKILPQPQMFYSQKPQKLSISIKQNLSVNPQRKFSSNIRFALQTTKNQKIQKTNIRFPNTNKNFSPGKPQITSASTYQINRQDEILEPKHFSQVDKNDKEPRKQPKKTPVSRLIQNILNKNRALQIQRNSSSSEKIMLGRSITFDNSDNLKRDIDALNSEEMGSNNQQYQMEVINENFSDEYLSINDSDTDEDDLPEQERNYLLEYIKSSHKTQTNDEDEDRPILEKNIKAKSTKQPKISGFREIRFKSIEEIYQKEVRQREPVHSNYKKLKPQSHKYKDNTSKTLIFKNQTFQAQFEDPSMVTFTHQKRLNERNQHRRTNKDPFILLQKKERNGRKPDKQIL